MKRSLVCVTHKEREFLFRAFVPDYMKFCNETEGFEFLIGLDGNNETILRICNDYSIPCLYSEHCEGVGMTKNRVLKSFPQYDFYFFIDDDVELVSPTAFHKIIQMSLKYNFEHISLGELHRFFGNVRNVTIDTDQVIYCDYGSGAFNFFTKQGLDVVGGFHDHFKKFKRYGHTEHSRRFYLNGLAPSPFVVLKGCISDFIWHNPVSKKPAIEATENNISIVEQEIINENLVFYPINVGSKYFLNGVEPWEKRKWRKFGRQAFPLLAKSERKTAISRKGLYIANLSFYENKRLKLYRHLFLYIWYGFPNYTMRRSAIALLLSPFFSFKKTDGVLKKLRF